MMDTSQKAERRAVVHEYEGAYGIVVWPSDAKKWRGRVDAPPAQETVTLRWEELPRTVADRYRDRGRYIVRFHLDGLELRMHKGVVGVWLTTREARRMEAP